MPVITHNSLNAAAQPIETEPLVNNQEAAPSQNGIADLVDIGDLSSPVTSSPTTQKPAIVTSGLDDLFSMLNDEKTAVVNNSETKPSSSEVLFGLDDSSKKSPAISSAGPPIVTTASLIDGFDIFSTTSEPAKPQSPSTMAINSRGVEGIIYVDSVFHDNQPALLRLIATNNNPTAVENFNFQAAVTKAYQIELMPPSSTSIPPNRQGSITQQIKIRRIASGVLKMRIKTLCTINGQAQTIECVVPKIEGLS
ncbi:hypothetical protein AB6A40_007846 [Gnathostoma spinigerum]|uniref:GAE domain-containing protein n=1 Tax=Gnathostoma spinigerum TaxID=75299 RepID=A0ABD6EWU5_9BILA